LRERIHQYLLTHPAGATSKELLSLVFTQSGSDPEFGRRFLRTLFDGDPRFTFRESEQRWGAAIHTALARPLSDTEFVVVDLETTGGSPARGDAIIEIGAVRIDRGRQLDFFQRLVDPGRRLPSFITQLTGITDDMLAGQRRLGEALPEFLEFVGDRVLVAHNAKFDLGFLEEAARRLFGRPIHLPHLCTMRLARQLVPDLRRRGLEAVASHFAIALVDRHRALGDARMTAEIFLRFLELLSRREITRLDQALSFQASARDGAVFYCPLPRTALREVPRAPGIYRFYGEDGRLLYVGKAKDLRQRVSSYLSNTAGHSNKTLSLIRHIHTVRVEHAGSELEAALMEAQAIRAEKPPYNRLRKHLPRIAFLKLTRDPTFPRLSIASRPSERGGACFGPFRSREAAARAQTLVTHLFRLRTCAGRLQPSEFATPCLQGRVKLCTAPCAGRVSPADYAQQVTDFLLLMRGDPELTARARERLIGLRSAHSEARRYQAAARAHRQLDELERWIRRERDLGWVVAHHHFLVLQPCFDRSAALVYVVLGGRLAERRTVRVGEDLERLAHDIVSGSSAAPAPFVRGEDLDGTVILAAWLRDRGDRDGYVFRLENPGAALRQIAEWRTALTDVLSTSMARSHPDGGSRQAAPAAEPEREGHEQHRHLAQR
jgi:DNA polymerase-3 subunit epsilon